MDYVLRETSNYKAFHSIEIDLKANQTVAWRGMGWRDQAKNFPKIAHMNATKIKTKEHQLRVEFIVYKLNECLTKALEIVVIGYLFHFAH